MSAGAATSASEQAALDSALGRNAARLLALLRQDRDRGVTIAAIRERGIEAPAQAIYTLQLAGYAIDRVAAAVDGHQAFAYRLRGGPHQKEDPDRVHRALGAPQGLDRMFDARRWFDGREMPGK